MSHLPPSAHQPFTPSSASLDPTETPVRPPTLSHPPADDAPSPPPTADDIHATHATYRRRVSDSLARLHPNSPRLHRYTDCARHWWIFQKNTDPTSYRFVRAFCHDRFCPTCAAKRSALIRHNLAAVITNQPHRFLTLTLRSTATPLRQQVDRLLLSFRKLRHLPWWNRYTKGGAAFFELTYNERTCLWHPHLHVILQGNYIPQPLLKTAWLAITTDSDIVHIRHAPSTDDVIRYVASYSTKTLPPSVTRHPTALDAVITAMRSRKTCYTFGTWNAFHLLHRDTDSDWTCLGTVQRPRGAPKHNYALLAALMHALDNYLAGLAPPTVAITTTDDAPPTERERPPPPRDPSPTQRHLFPAYAAYGQSSPPSLLP